MRTATYRVQLRAEFGFAEASRVSPYLSRIGVSHLYCSPYLQAARGSSHGYDVVDHGAVNEELGGATGRDALCAVLRRLNLKQLIDIVPNHMAIRGGHNEWWWDVLENGPSSLYSSFFDVEWRIGDVDRVLLPILGDQYGIELEAGKIRVSREGARFFVRYYEHKNPLAPRSLGAILRPVASQVGNDELAFLADSYLALPSPSVRDLESRERRHREKNVLERWLVRLCEESEIAEAIDLELARLNANFDDLDQVLGAQNYRLADWRFGNSELDYRRFFDIDHLIGLRVEDPKVLESTHRLILEWMRDGSVDGVRIDHVDGLYDPSSYLSFLRNAAPKSWILVEKILESGEDLPAFPIDGTTGYDFLSLAQQVLLDPEGQGGLDTALAEFSQEQDAYPAMVDSAKRQVLREALGSDLRRLTGRFGDLCEKHRTLRDSVRQDMETLITEFCVAFPVYRSYVNPHSSIDEADRRRIVETCAKVQVAAPELDGRLVQFFQDLLLLRWKDPEEADFALRLQQLTGPVMAKGVEDTVFYRYFRLVALNEVGGDPSHFGVSDTEFHEQMAARQERCPATLNATSTHDTKRSEDVRARILVLSEIPELWLQRVRGWSELVRSGQAFGSKLDRATEYSLWQNLLGAWPIDKNRVSEFLIKAVREAKLHTSWQNQNQEYEQAALEFVEAIYKNQLVLRNIEGFCELLSVAADSNALNQLLLKLTCPGVPDIYQGSELWDRSLVDPDNRRPVDFAERERLLASLPGVTPEALWSSRKNGAIKLHYLITGLRVRRSCSAAFDRSGSYSSLQAEGPSGRRVLAFQRGCDVIVAILRFHQRHAGDPLDGFLSLPEGTYRDELTGRSHSGRVALGELFLPFPSLLLTRTS